MAPRIIRHPLTLILGGAGVALLGIATAKKVVESFRGERVPANTPQLTRPLHHHTLNGK